MRLLALVLTGCAMLAGGIAEAMGDPFKRYLSVLLPPTLANLADAKVCCVDLHVERVCSDRR